MNILYLIPDTNVFIQCRQFEEFGWDEWSSKFDEVQIVICRPVQRQIDNLKYRGNGRVGKRARRTNSLIGQILGSGKHYVEITQTSPRVKLSLDVSCSPSPELAKHLDYSEVDNKIVGCLHAFRELRSGVDARLLTNDIGVMATAEMLSLPYERVREDWLLEPESSTEARKIKKLQAENKQLRDKEPQFQLKCLDDDENVTEEITVEASLFRPLSDDDVHEVLYRIRTRFPIAEDFGSRERATRRQKSFGILLDQEMYTPASDEEIAAYRDQGYPDWLQQCETKLRELHNALQIAEGPPEFCIVAENIGTRPGKDVLVTFSAKGKFQIRPPPWNDEHEHQAEDDDSKSIHSDTATLKLPDPPVPPRGEWSSELGQYGDVLGHFDRLHKNLTRMQHVPSVLSARPERDPNEFYYKGGRPENAGAGFSLQCRQWRHNIGEEQFIGELFFDRDAGDVEGSLECEIHAENLANPVKEAIRVRIHVRPVSARESSDKLVAELIANELE